MANNNTSDQQQKLLDSIKFSRLVIPIFLGLAVVGYLIWRQFDYDEFSKIQWDNHLLFWVMMAVLMYVIRHLFYAWRLKVLSYNEFGWFKSIELIFIWEFSSSISPTSIGGSAVALFFLGQEKISGARTVAMVIYTVVTDTVFFVITMPFLFFLLGGNMIRPGGNIDGIGITFLLILIAMTTYGFLFFWGLFVNPKSIKRFFLWVSSWRILKRFRKEIAGTAMDIEASSKVLRSKPLSFHSQVWISTAGAWITRFLAINFIIVALVSTRSFDFMDHLVMYARGEAMYAITAFSPTPGGAGIAEIVFGGFYSDFISESLGSFAALIWRLITYYVYLIAGVIIIPNWIRNLINRKKTSSNT